MHRSATVLRHFAGTLLIFTFTGLFCSYKPAVTEYGIFAPSRLESVIGQDGVCSIEFSDELTLWTFADTITGNWRSESGRISADKNEAEITGMLSNSIATSDRITEKNFKNIRFEFYRDNGKITPFIKNSKNEDPLYHRLWALDGFRSGNKLYVYYLHVFVPDHTKFLDFKVLYTGLARWDIPAGWKPGDKISFKRLGKIFGPESPYFGAAVMEKDEFIYLAGHFKTNMSRFPLSFAKVKIEDVEQRESYSFLSSDSKWIKDVNYAGKFINDVSGECSLSYNQYLEQFIIIYSRVYTGEIMSVRFNDFSDLPMTNSESLLTTGIYEKGKMWAYSAKEIFSSNNRLFLIYIDPSRYQPLLVELKY